MSKLEIFLFCVVILGVAILGHGLIVSDKDYAIAASGDQVWRIDQLSGTVSHCDINGCFKVKEGN